jgi:hypothetical protein
MNNKAIRKLIRLFLVLLALILKTAYTPLSGQSHIEELSNNINTLNNNQGNNINERSLIKFGFGGGICLKGGSVGFEFSIIRPNNWGGNISYKSNICKSGDIPSDWAEGGRTFYPKNYTNLVSLNLVREIPTAQNSTRFGIEGGLSCVIFSQARLEPNPDYDPNPDPQVNWMYKIGTKYKYEKSHFRSGTIGAALRVKVEFLLSPHTGLELAAFTNINSLMSTAGLELHYIFGRIN